MTETLYPIRRNLMTYLRSHRRAGAAAALAAHGARSASVRVDARCSRLVFVFPAVSYAASEEFDRTADSDRAAVVLDAPPRFIPYFLGPDLPFEADDDLEADLEFWKAHRGAGATA